MLQWHERLINHFNLALIAVKTNKFQTVCTQWKNTSSSLQEPFVNKHNIAHNKQMSCWFASVIVLYLFSAPFFIYRHSGLADQLDLPRVFMDIHRRGMIDT